MQKKIRIKEIKEHWIWIIGFIILWAFILYSFHPVQQTAFTGEIGKQGVKVSIESENDELIKNAIDSFIIALILFSIPIIIRSIAYYKQIKKK